MSIGMGGYPEFLKVVGYKVQANMIPRIPNPLVAIIVQCHVANEVLVQF